MNAILKVASLVSLALVSTWGVVSDAVIAGAGVIKDESSLLDSQRALRKKKSKSSKKAKSGKSAKSGKLEKPFGGKECGSETASIVLDESSARDLCEQSCHTVNDFADFEVIMNDLINEDGGAICITGWSSPIEWPNDKSFEFDNVVDLELRIACCDGMCKFTGSRASISDRDEDLIRFSDDVSMKAVAFSGFSFQDFDFDCCSYSIFDINGPGLFVLEDSVIDNVETYEEAIIDANNGEGKIVVLRKNAFKNNKSIDIDGSVLNFQYGELIVVKNEFRNNTSTYGGGAIQVSDAHSAFLNNNFFGNKAFDNGGAIKMDDGGTYLEGNVFENNVADDDEDEDGDGGAIYISNDMGLTSLKNKYLNNTAYDGGAFEVGEGIFEFLQDYFYNNTSYNDGGAIYVDEEAQITIRKSVFEENNTTQSGSAGGAIFADEESVFLEISDTDFINNVADDDGGAIEVEKEGTLIVKNSKFKNNKAGSGGGAVSFEDGGLQVEGSLFFNNTGGTGGAIKVQEDASVKVKHTDFIDNWSKCHGGAINMDEGRVVSEGNLYKNNRADCSGGAIYVEDESSVRSYGDRFLDNNATDDGGAVYLDENGHVFVRTDFIGNSAGRDGGAIYMEDATVSSKGSYFDDNDAARVGSDIFLDKGTFATCGDCLDTDNIGLDADEIVIEQCLPWYFPGEA